MSIAALCYVLWALPAYAQNGSGVHLVEASPAPDAVLDASPSSIELTFDHLLNAEGSSITLTSEDESYTFTDAAIVDPTNQFHISLKLPPLIPGTYIVEYTIKSIGSSTLTVGSYTFSVMPPVPQLELLSPVNGQAFAQGEPIPLKMRVQTFEFGFFDNRIRIYVDDELYDEIQATIYQIEGLAPGVHEIRTVLAQLEDTEFPDTTISVNIAIAQPDAETEGREQAAVAPPDRGLQLSALQIVGVMLLTAILLGIGIWLGRSTSGG